MTGRLITKVRLPTLYFRNLDDHEQSATLLCWASCPILRGITRGRCSLTKCAFDGPLWVLSRLWMLSSSGSGFWHVSLCALIFCGKFLFKLLGFKSLRNLKRGEGVPGTQCFAGYQWLRSRCLPPSASATQIGHAAIHSFAGRMFWFRWKTFSASHLALICASLA